jgi:tetratricopeptide (TPR) repeat protein
MRAVQRRRPGDLWLNLMLGFACHQAQPPRLEEAVAFYRAALALRPESAAVHYSLGNVLEDLRRHEEAIAAFHDALARRPDYAEAYCSLGNSLLSAGRPDEAIAALNRSLDLRPESPMAHYNLGNALRAKKQLAQAAASYWEAVRLRPNYPKAHCNLGIALDNQGQDEEAEAAYRRALAWKADLFEGHYNLGLLLHKQGRAQEAEAAFQRVVQLRPDLAGAHDHLGLARMDQRRFAQAEAAFRAAVRLDPDELAYLNNLGNALRAQEKLAEAAAAYREVIHRNPGQYGPYFNLGHTLRGLGRFAESRDAFRQGHALAVKDPGWREPSDRWVRDAERLANLDARLPRVLEGQDKPADAELPELANLCHLKRRFADAARFYTAAFAARSALADDLGGAHRYNAACAAALAGCGQGEDNPRPNVRERHGFRTQAHDWLRDDLKALTALADGGKAADKALVVEQLRGWKQDVDLSGVRDRAVLDKLPETERDAWRKLWADVETLLKRTEQP